MACIDNKLMDAESKLTESDHILTQYKNEMEILTSLYHEQDALIHSLEEEQLEQEYDKVKQEECRYTLELETIKSKLANCEEEVAKCRCQIGSLVEQIEKQTMESKQNDAMMVNDQENQEQAMAMMEHLRASIQEKQKEIQLHVSFVVRSQGPSLVPRFLFSEN